MVTARSTGLNRELWIFRWRKGRRKSDGNRESVCCAAVAVLYLFATTDESDCSKSGHVAQRLGNTLSTIHFFTHFRETNIH